MARTHNSTAFMQVACAMLFVAFTFVYLRFYQADVLAMAQHVLSDGNTSYQRDVGAVLITLSLSLLALGVYALCQLRTYTHAWTYFPSLLALTVITDPSEYIDRGFSFGHWLWVVPLLLAVFLAVVWISRSLLPTEVTGKTHGFSSSLLWINMLQLLVMLLLMTLVSNHRDVFHHLMRMETLMMKGEYQKALEVGKRSWVTDSSLTMLRIACLEKTGELGERLFTYPLVGKGEAMRANGNTVRTMMWQEKRRRHTADYVLTKYLLDKNLDGFVARIGKYYQIDSTNVPRHFREALVLYTHTRGNPAIVFHDNVMDADFRDYQTLAGKHNDPVVRQNALRDTYGNTYWYYYQYAE